MTPANHICREEYSDFIFNFKTFLKKSEKSDFLFLFSCFSLVVDSQIDTLNLFFLFLFGKYEVSFAAFEEIYFIGGKS